MPEVIENKTNNNEFYFKSIYWIFPNHEQPN
jgi:hypothetical protein